MSIKNNTASLQDLLNAVNALPNAGVELPELTNPGTADDLLLNKQLIDGDGNVVEGTIPTKTSADLTANGATVTTPAGYYAVAASKTVATVTQVTPSIEINSDGLITATATQTAGYVSAGTKSATKQLATQAAVTVTPTKSIQTAVAKDVYTTGAVTVAAIPEEYITTSDATAEASEIMSGETAYVNGAKVTGTFTIDEELNTQDDLIAQIATALEGKSAGGEQATPEISVSSNGLITATAGVKSSTYQMAFQPAKTITPSATNQVAVSSGYYTGGNITVAAVPTQIKSVTPTAATQNVTPDSGKFLSKVTVTGDSNLVAGNIKSGVSIFGVSGTAQVGGGTGVDDVSRAIINRTITEISDDKLQIIGSYAFYSCSKLTTASFPACTRISGAAFCYCDSLTTISFPACTRISSTAFYYCSKLTTANFPACTSIGGSAFCGCSKLTTANFPACTSIGGSAFCSCNSLTTASFPVCTNIGSYAFRYCSNLTIASFPACTSIRGSAFGSCDSLTTASFPVCTNIGSYAFFSCRTLSILQLGASSICTLANSNAFSSTPFAGYSSYFSGTPHIYVPASLITAYQSATNWAYFSSYFSTIESTGDNNGDAGDNGDTTLITFTINNIEYQAENGMTWEQFINSQYNTDNFSIDSLEGIIMTSDGLIIFDQDFNPCNFGDLILNGAAYIASM